MTARVVSGMAELYPLLDLTGVRVFELSAKRKDGFGLDGTPADPNTSNLEVSLEAGPTRITFRSRVAVSTADAIIAADVAAEFAVREEIAGLPERILEEFSRTAGLPVVLPYLRVEIQQLARQIGVAAPILKHYWAPDFDQLTTFG